MRKLFNSLVDMAVARLLKDHAIQESEKEIYQFGVEVTVLKIIHMLSYFTIAVCLGKVLEFVIIFSVFYVFRCNTGGFHAKTRLGCYLFSCSMILISLLFVSLKVPLLIINGLLIAELILIIRISPVENENRNLDLEEIVYFKKRLYLISFIFISLFCLAEYLGLFYLLRLSMIGFTLETVLTVMGKLQSHNIGIN